MEKQPSEFDIKDVTQRTQLQSEMNRHASWLIYLGYILDIQPHIRDMVKSRSFLASMIDRRAKE